MAAEQNVDWRMTRPFSSLVTTIRTQFIGENASPSDVAARADEHERGTTETRSDPDVAQLLSPRERVLELLEENGGRMKQSAIVSSVEWSESTVSRKLGTLEDAGDVLRYRIGREKLVFLPGAEPDTFHSPFEAEPEKTRLSA